MNKYLSPKGRSIITTTRTQEHGDTPKSTRFINSKEQTAAGNITDPEEYTNNSKRYGQPTEKKTQHNTQERHSKHKEKARVPEDREESKNKRKQKKNQRGGKQKRKYYGNSTQTGD